MCALFGFLDYGKKIPLKALQKLVQALANASEERGTHASGIAYNHDNRLTIYKRPKPAHKMRFRIPADTTAVMGHTRFTTQGDQKFNHNNHPFRGYAGTEFALAHNGVLYNDRELRITKHLPDAKIETDSYIAVQLIEEQKALDFGSLASMAEDVMGNFTFTILDENDNLWFVKGSSPLHLIHFPELGLYVYSSTAGIMHKALMKLGLNLMPYNVIETEEGDLLKITPDGEVVTDHFSVPTFFSGKIGWGFGNWDYPEDEIDDDSFALLMDMCGYYGVTPEQIQHLRDIGFSYDEIEDYLFDPSDFCDDLICGEL